MDRVVRTALLCLVSVVTLHAQGGQTEEDPRAGAIASSFHHALIVAMRPTAPAAPGKRVPVLLVHDGLPGRDFQGKETFPPGGPSEGEPLSKEMYVFEVPSDQDPNVVLRFPADSTGSQSSDGGKRFRMADPDGSPYVRRCLAGDDGGDRAHAAPGSVWKRDDGDDLDAYEVDFEGLRVPDANGSIEQPLFEFRIHVYRDGNLAMTLRSLIAGN